MLFRKMKSCFCTYRVHTHLNFRDTLCNIGKQQAKLSTTLIFLVGRNCQDSSVDHQYIGESNCWFLVLTDFIANKEKLQLSNYKCVESHEEVLGAMGRSTGRTEPYWGEWV